MPAICFGKNTKKPTPAIGGDSGLEDRSDGYGGGGISGGEAGNAGHNHQTSEFPI